MKLERLIDLVRAQAVPHNCLGTDALVVDPRLVKEEICSRGWHMIAPYSQPWPDGWRRRGLLREHECRILVRDGFQFCDVCQEVSLVWSGAGAGARKVRQPTIACGKCMEAAKHRPSDIRRHLASFYKARISMLRRGLFEWRYDDIRQPAWQLSTICSLTDRHLINNRFKGCAYCGLRADTDDHIVSQKDGGHNVPENVLRACRSCNSTKGRRSAVEFATQLSQLGKPVWTPIDTLAAMERDYRDIYGSLTASEIRELKGDFIRLLEKPQIGSVFPFTPVTEDRYPFVRLIYPGFEGRPHAPHTFEQRAFPFVPAPMLNEGSPVIVREFDKPLHDFRVIVSPPENADLRYSISWASLGR